MGHNPQQQQSKSAYWLQARECCIKLCGIGNSRAPTSMPSPVGAPGQQAVFSSHTSGQVNNLKTGDCTEQFDRTSHLLSVCRKGCFLPLLISRHHFLAMQRCKPSKAQITRLHLLQSRYSFETWVSPESRVRSRSCTSGACAAPVRQQFMTHLKFFLPLTHKHASCSCIPSNT